MILNKKVIIYISLIFSLLVGYYFKEDPAGGGRIDFEVLFPLAQKLIIDFKSGLTLYLSNSFSLIHSPVFTLIVSSLLKFLDSLLVLNIFYILFSSSLPYFFFLILKNKFNLDNNYIFYISVIIFISPYFRSSGIWLLGDNLALIFFSLSVLFYINTFKDKDKIINYFLCLLFLILCSYVRYYYSLYAIFFLINFYQSMKKIDFIFLLFSAFLLSLPALFYLFYVIVNYNFLGSLNNFGSINIYGNILIIFSIIIFYLVPVIISEIFKIISYIKKNKLYFSIIFLFILSAYLIDKNSYIDLIFFSPRGGGLFVKFFNLFNLDLKLFMSLIAFLSFIVLDYLFQGNKLKNYSLLVILIFSLPLVTLYQKYLDPLIYFIIFGLVKSDILYQILKNQKMKLSFFYIYFFSFYLLSLIYQLKMV
tara:strand:+ start:1684 stop:2943 length:1260 start_codon:yes stop_codon:yes gene_type:complete